MQKTSRQTNRKKDLLNMQINLVSLYHHVKMWSGDTYCNSVLPGVQISFFLSVLWTDLVNV